MADGVLLLAGDARRLPLPDESVDLIVTSPPYWSLRNYFGVPDQIGREPTPTAFLVNLWQVADECYRVLKPTGSLFVNLGDRFAGSAAAADGISNKSTLVGNGHRGGVSRAGKTNKIHSIPRPRDRVKADVRDKSLVGLPWRFAIGLSCPITYREPTDPSWSCWHGETPCSACRAHTVHPQWILRTELIFEKLNGLPESVTDRVRRNHEQVFHLVKRPHYFSNLTPIREPHARQWAGGNNGGRGGWDRGDHLNVGLPDAAPHPYGRLPVSVWRIASEPLRPPDHLAIQHYAAFPTELPRRVILGWSPPGAVVLDPFGGTGTTAMIAAALDRRGIHLDRSDAYNRLARWRIGESGHAQRCLTKAAKKAAT